MLDTLFAEGRWSLILDSEMVNTLLRFIPFISQVSLRCDSEDTDGWCMAMIGLYGLAEFSSEYIQSMFYFSAIIILIN